VSFRLVLDEQDVANPVTYSELGAALRHAAISRPEHRAKRGKRKGQITRKAYLGQQLEKYLVRILANSALKLWEEDRRVILPLLAANVIRKAIPLLSTDDAREVENRYEGYKRAVMKVMSMRGHWKQKSNRKKRKEGIPVPPVPKQTEHPVETEPDQKGQLRLFS